MKRLIVLRHSLKNSGSGNVTLSLPGQNLAFAVGKKLKEAGLLDSVTVLVGSDQIRTIQTGLIILTAAEKAVMKVVQNSLVFTTRFDEWVKYLPSKETKLPECENVLGYLKRTQPEFYKSEAESVANAYLSVFDSFKDGEVALIVGHSPTTEMVIATLAEEDPNNISDLKECEGWEIIMENGKISIKILP